MSTIGELNVPVVIEKPVATDDGAGGQTNTWHVLTRAWARIRVNPAVEKPWADRLSDPANYQVTLRYHGAIATGMRIVTPDATLEITATADPAHDRRWLVCLCRRRHQEARS